MGLKRLAKDTRNCLFEYFLREARQFGVAAPSLDADVPLKTMHRLIAAWLNH